MLNIPKCFSFTDLCWSSTTPFPGWPVTLRPRTAALACPSILWCSIKCTTSLWPCCNARRWRTESRTLSGNKQRRVKNLKTTQQITTVLDFICMRVTAPMIWVGRHYTWDPALWRRIRHLVFITLTQREKVAAWRPKKEDGSADWWCSTSLDPRLLG